MSRFLKELESRILLLDGATGTQYQALGLKAEDYGGLDGCSEILCETRPDLVRAVHERYFSVGSDGVETNSFGANPVVLAEYGIAERAFELAKLSAELARGVAEAFTKKTPRKPRFVIGSLGPGTKLPSLGHIDFNTMAQGYAAQAAGLVAGGADALLFETCQDPLQIKAGLAGAESAFADASRRLPVMVQVTMELTGAMLVGTTMEAVIALLEPYEIVSLGLNCATGPAEMERHVKVLSELWPRMISVLPNAGLPENVGGKAVYKLTPDEMARYQEKFIKEYGVNIIGGCCGTSPDHMAALAPVAEQNRPKARSVSWSVGRTASLYSAVELRQEPPPFIVGERTNANGSKKFRDLLQAEDYDAITELAKEQEREGAHAVDLCVAFTGRNEERDMIESVARIAAQITVPLMVDSTNPGVMEAALERIGGRAIINSINLEEGEERFDRICRIAKRHGAALVALVIDEEGMAKTLEKKMAVARRIIERAVEHHGLKHRDLIFDMLTFTLASGDEAMRDAGVNTIEAIRRLKAEFPEVNTILGLSNISFGLKPESRVVLNSVFMHHCIAAGLDQVIANAKKLVPLAKIDPETVKLAEALIFNDKANGDPLMNFINHFESGKGSVTQDEEKLAQLPPDERLKQRIIDGNRQGIEGDIAEVLKTRDPLTIINTILLDGMKAVGELFGSGKMQLPFVLQSAETMKAAVKTLEPHMDKTAAAARGTMVLATVVGDVHDIGKNLVEIILSNNGYRVINLGIKVPVETMIESLKEHKADAVGMSGLLVKSTQIMKENLAVMRGKGIEVPVICGGAALTKRFVDHDLSEAYGQPVFYGLDAFAGLAFMDKVVSGGPLVSEKTSVVSSVKKIAPSGGSVPERSEVSREIAVPAPPFWGTRVVTDLDLDAIYPYINTTALFRNSWRFHKNAMSDADYQKLLEDKVIPLFEGLKEKYKSDGTLAPAVVYGYFPVQSEGDDLIVYDADQRTELGRFRFPRQKKAPYHCIADFFKSKTSGAMDLLALHAVTVGGEARAVCQELYAADKYTDYFYLHGLSVETAEALAEYWHKKVREELGIAGEDSSDVKGLFKQEYRGSRYSFGYPACPNLEDQELLFKLLKPERIGLSLSDGHQLVPEQSTTCLVVHHPQAKYFSV